MRLRQTNNVFDIAEEDALIEGKEMSKRGNKVT